MKVSKKILMAALWASFVSASAATDLVRPTEDDTTPVPGGVVRAIQGLAHTVDGWWGCNKEDVYKTGFGSASICVAWKAFRGDTSKSIFHTHPRLSYFRRFPLLKGFHCHNALRAVTMVAGIYCFADGLGNVGVSTARYNFGAQYRTYVRKREKGARSALWYNGKYREWDEAVGRWKFPSEHCENTYRLNYLPRDLIWGDLKKVHSDGNYTLAWQFKTTFRGSPLGRWWENDSDKDYQDLFG